METLRTARPYHHGDLRSALLVAAEAMLERVGPEALSLREVTREIGVSNNAPRRHFPNRQSLLDALAVQGFERMGAALDEAASSNEPEFMQRLLAVVNANIRFVSNHRALFRLMFASKQRSDASAELRELSYRALSSGPKTIAYGQSIGAVIEGDTIDLALTIFSAVEGLISLSVEGRLGGIPIEEVAKVVIGNIMVGLKPR
nr:TetR/AcrR family transcriptional regulator [Pseudomonas sp. MWU16-30317]